jgi:hypothetical protein
MLPGTSFGTATRLTATGASVITSGNSYIIGILFQGTGTGSLSLWAGTTATTTAGGSPLSGVIRAFATAAGATVNPASYFPFPAYASGGITVNVPATADASITLFWAPAGGA